MDEVEKPFTCIEEDCNMELLPDQQPFAVISRSFINDDHLQVHKAHHEMLLSSSNSGNLQPNTSNMKHSGFLIDQTPTPSRFLKHFEEVSLFQDINLNPFDLEFRKASQNKTYKAQLSISENHGISGSLETPRILPPADSDETISSTSHEDSHLSVPTRTNHESPVSSIITTTSNTVITISNSQHNTLRVVESTNDPERKDARKKLTLNVSSSSALEGSQNSNVISTPTPVITAGPSVSQSLGLNCSTPTLNTPNIPQITLNGVDIPLSDLNTPGLSPTLRITATPPLIKPNFKEVGEVLRERTPFDAVSTTTYTSTSISVPTTPTFSYSNSAFPQSPSATVLQLLLKLPDGQAIPVEIPATPVASSALYSNPTTSVVTKISPAYQTTAFTSVITNPTPSLAKMKLKQVLSSSSTAARPGATKYSRATTADRIAEMTRNRNLSGTSSNGDVQEENSSSSTSSSSSSSSSNNSNSSCSVVNQSNAIKAPKQRRNSNSNENPEEKRKKFLERNRVAAVRCREKKKRLVESMVAKSDELSIMNHKLQCEVVSLRSEVASLKTLLLRHRNCPVTLAMQAGELSEVKLEDKDASNGLIKTFLTSQSLIPCKEVNLKSINSSLSSETAEEQQISVSETLPLNSAMKIRKRSHSVSSISLSGSKIHSTNFRNVTCDDQPTFSVIEFPKSDVNCSTTAINASITYNYATEAKPNISIPLNDLSCSKSNILYVSSLKPNPDVAVAVPKELSFPATISNSYKLPCLKEVPNKFNTSIIIQNYSPTGKNSQSPMKHNSVFVQDCESILPKESRAFYPTNSRAKIVAQPKLIINENQTLSSDCCIGLVPDLR